MHTSDGERIAADVVVLNPDLPVAYRDLLPPSAAPRRIGRLRYCAVLRAAACRARPRAYSGIAHHNIHFGRAWAATFDELIAGGR